MFDLTWVAQFKDQVTIDQYKVVNDKLEEVSFKNVIDKQDELEKFILLNRARECAYVVNLVNGCIYSAPLGTILQQPREDMLKKDNYKYRLIYFREIERTFGSDMKEIGEPKVLFFIGFQYLDEDGKNHKRIMKICSSGSWVIN